MAYILPSQIHDILDGKTFQRHVPSDGLRYGDISYVLKSHGFGCKVYSLENRLLKIPGFSEDEFYRIFSTYVESAIPMIAAVSGDNLGHAIVCVGQEKIDRSSIAALPELIFKSGKKYRHWSDVKRKFVFNDDNVPAYAVTEYSCPTPQYKPKNPKITSLIVPLYNRLYLDAPRAIKVGIEWCGSGGLFNLPDHIVIRTLLASTHTYKDFFVSDSLVPVEMKLLFIQNVALPKFIWITEISTLTDFEARTVNALILMDATEPMKYDFAYPLLAIFDKNCFFYDPIACSFRRKMLTLPFKISSFENLQ